MLECGAATPSEKECQSMRSSANFIAGVLEESPIQRSPLHHSFDQVPPNMGSMASDIRQWRTPQMVGSMRYFFNIKTDGRVVLDMEGQDLPSHEAARLEATSAAKEIIGRELMLLTMSSRPVGMQRMSQKRWDNTNDCSG